MKVFKLLEDNFNRTGNPLGVKIDSKWVTEFGIPFGGKRILFTGLSYQLMPYTLSVLNMLERGKSILILGKLSKFGFSRFIPKKEAEVFYDALRAGFSLLRQKIDFGFLYEEEVYDGAVFYDFGMDWLVDECEKRLEEVFQRNGVEEVITISPHSYFMLKKVYNLDLEVKHILELIELLKIDYVLHEPCILARKTDFGEKLSKCGFLPERSGKLTSCCGGPVELFYPELSKAICVNRAEELEEAAKAHNLENRFVTACPICLMNFLRCGYKAEDCLTVFAREGDFGV